MRYCAQCGRPLGDEDRVCGYCGMTQPATPQPKTQQPPQRRQNPPAGKGRYEQSGKKMSGGMLALIIVLCVVIVAAIVTIVLLATRDKTPENSNPAANGPSWLEEAETTENSAPEAVIGETYYVTGVANTIPVWESAGSGATIAQMYTGDEVTVVDAGGTGYWKVQLADGSEGYLDCHYLTQEWGAVMGPEVFYANEDDVTLLESPSPTDSRTLGFLLKGDEVTVLAKPSGSYWYVYSDRAGNYGFVQAACLSAELEEERIIGTGNAPTVRTMLYYVDSGDGFLSLREEPTTQSMELDRITTGSEVWVIDTLDSPFWYVYAPTLSKYGYVHSDYLSTVRTDEVEGEEWTVRVDSGYLALRTAKAYDYSNEIGKLYTGDTVYVIRKEGTYWWVFAPTLDKYGYVNGDYLR